MRLTLRCPSASTRAATVGSSRQPGREEGRGAGVEVGAAALDGVGEHGGGVPVAGPEEGVGAGVEHEGDAGLLTGGDGILDGAHGIRQGLELVLEVGPDDADVDGAARWCPWRRRSRPRGRR